MANDRAKSNNITNVRTLATIFLLVLTVVNADQASPHYYTRYSSYPPYCSSPDATTGRFVPPLTDSSAKSNDLVHVTVVVRHGQRTPYKGGVPCWNRYHAPKRDTGAWDCDDPAEVSLVAPSDGGGASLAFAKRYDARSATNVFKGTCGKAQLLPEGVAQQTRNGAMLREAYLGDARDGDVLGGSNLFLRNDADDDKTTPPNHDPRHVVFRSDDEQRTLASGEVLLRELFATENHDDDDDDDDDRPKRIVVHTVDDERDVMRPNESICPALKHMRREAERSDEFRTLNSSDEANELRQFLEKDLGGGKVTNDNKEGDQKDRMDFILECLMTTMCTDRELPDAVNDYGTGKGKKGMFERLVDFATIRKTFHLLHNDAAYSKLAMGPLWYEILDKIKPLLDVERSNNIESFFDTMRDRGVPRFALYSGHDSTIMPLLASLGENVYDGKEWTPYASMLMIEVRAARDDGPLTFRLLYNGEVLTDRVDSCPPGAQLCDLNRLLDAVGPFATLERPMCDEETSDDDDDGGGDARNAAFEFPSLLFRSTTERVVAIFVALGSAALGGACTRAFMTKRSPFRRRNDDADDDAYSTGDEDEFAPVIQLS